MAIGREQKKKALSVFLGVSPAEVRESAGHLYGHPVYYAGPEESAYLVLSEDEADVAAQIAVGERLWVITLDALYDFYGIMSYPADALLRLAPAELRNINDALRKLVDGTSGEGVLADSMLALGNRANILADYDQKENKVDDFFIYRLY